MALEESMKAMKEPYNYRDFMEEEPSGLYVQGKCKRTQASETLHRHICCLVTIMGIAVSTIILSVTLTMIKERPATEVHMYSVCPPMWIGFGNKCFYFSEDTRNWTFSQTSCASLEADLVQIDTEDEMNFLKRYKGPFDHWIGLSRESPNHSWKWTTNTTGNYVFKIRGTGECAYLNDNGVSSSRIYSERKWICSKPNSHVRSCEITSNF